MIVLHRPTETNFNKNGKAILKGAILRGTLSHKINGACMITIEMLKGNPKTDLVDKEDIISCPTPFGIQPFRVFDINPLGLDRVQIVARHIFFDLQKRVVKRCKVENSNGQFILDKYLLNLDRPVPHKLYSDMKELVSLDWQLKQGVDILLGDEENSFINKFGKGELRVDGFNGYIDSRIGRNRGFRAKYRKNITGFSGKTSTDGLITYIIPKGFDGITLPDNGGVESPLISKYADVYTRVIEFPEVKFKGSPNNSSKEGFETLEEAQAELRKVALAYFTDTECDIIKASFNIDLIMLKDTLEYKDVAVSEEIQLGDTITVDYSPYNITMEKRLVGYTYNILTEKMETLEVGDYGLDYFRSINNKIDKLPDVEQIVGGLENDINSKIEEFTEDLLNGGNGSYVKFVPNFHNPREILVLDNEDEAKAKKVIRINKEGIGVSTTGVTGKYYGLVVDGKLVVTEATATKIVASLIQGGMLASIDNSSYVNLDNGEFNFKDKIKYINGVFSITLSSGETLEQELSGIDSTLGDILTDVGTLNNTISEVIINYDKIINRVSAVEKDLNTQSEKIKNVESEITKDAIIDKVSETIESAKEEAINEANNNTEEALKPYAKSSEVKHTVDSWVAKFSEIGGENILLNGRPRIDTYRWYITHAENIAGDKRLLLGGMEGENWQGEVFKSGIWWRGTFDASGNWCCLFNDSIMDYKFSPNKTYSISLIMYSEHAKTVDIGILDGNGLNTVTYHKVNLNPGYQFVNIEFTPAINGNKPCLGFYMQDRGYFNIYIPWAVVKEGKATKNWIGNSNEIREGSTQIDLTGVTVFNGALRIKNKANVTVFEGDDNGDLTLTGRVINGKNGYTSYLDRGGLILETTGEKVGYVRSSSFASNRLINGLSIGALGSGDYVDIGYTNDSDLAESTSLAPMIRLAKTIHDLIGNFRGIQLKEDTRVDYTKLLSFQNNTSYTSDVYANNNGKLCIMGDNGLLLGYKEGESYTSSINIDESTKNIDFYGNMRDVKNGYAYNVMTRLNHGSVEKFAPRITNMNAYLDSGWYSFGSDCSGTPTGWGIMLTFRAFSTDMCQIVHGTNNVLYIRWYINGSYTSWKQW